MIEVLFALFLYGLGVLLLLPAKSVPVRFVAWSAFGWGALAWTGSALLALILPFSYSPATVLATLAVAVLAYFALFSRHLQRPSGTAVRALWLPAALFVLVVSIPSLLQVVHVLPDSFDMLIIARDIADGEPSPATLEMLGLYGPAWPLLQTPASWLGLGAFTSLPAAIAFTLVASLRYFCLEGLQRLGWAARPAVRIADLVTLLFVSTLWVFFQFTYFHNGSLAALYLLLGVGGLWLAMVDGQKSWLWLGTVALLGLSLARAETVVFPIAFLVLAVARGRFLPREWLGPLLPLTGVQLAWYGWLGLAARPETPYLSPGRIALFAGLVGLLFLGVLTLTAAPVRRLVLPRLSGLLFSGLGIAVLLAVVVYPENLANPLESTAQNFFLLGTLWWGLIWWLVIALFILVARAPHFAYQELFAGVIVAFWALYLLLGMLAGGYSIRADSSGSRMGLHILPVVFLFLALRAAPYLAEETTRP